MSNDVGQPVSDADVVALAKAAIEQSRDDINQRAVDAQAPPQLQQQQPGITIDLGHKNIAHLPDEVIDVIRAEIERYAPCCVVVAWRHPRVPAVNGGFRQNAQY